jgi:hypothetical protein
VFSSVVGQFYLSFSDPFQKVLDFFIIILDRDAHEDQQSQKDFEPLHDDEMPAFRRGFARCAPRAVTFSDAISGTNASAGPMSFLCVIDRARMGLVSHELERKARDPLIWTRLLRDDYPASVHPEDAVSWLFDRRHGFKFQFNHLLEISVRCCDIGDIALAEAARSCHGLVALDVSGCYKLTDKSFKTVAYRCRGLVTLKAADCPSFTDTGVCAISRYCRGLTALDVSGCYKLTDQSFKTVAYRCRGLTTLKAADCPKLTDTGVCAISRYCRGLTALDVSDCLELTDQSMIHICTGLASLTNLFVGGCFKFTETSFHEIASSCKLLRLIYIGTRYELGILRGSFKKNFPKIKVETLEKSIPYP